MLAMRSTITKRTGMMNTAMIVAASMPTITTVPRMRRDTAPEPVAVHSGTQPRMKAKLVMRMGRRRSLAPSRAASTRPRPFSSSSLANSTMRMAFLAERPMSITRPIWANTPKSYLRAHSPKNAPKMAMGTESSTEKGRDQLSYRAARMRNTNTRDRANTRPVVPSAFFSW
jgi:hypothetical protein